MMTEATNGWLEMREPVDARSRSRRMAEEFIDQSQQCELIVDLACGTGSNYRYLNSFTQRNRSWLALDNDPIALDIAKLKLQSQLIRFEQLDLSSDFSRVPYGPTTAIAASAFLDIASEAWLSRFASHCRQSQLLIAMTVAGQPIWEPTDDCDEAIRKCIESYQHADHGFGSALGSKASSFLAQQLRHHNCQVEVVASDWNLDSRDTPLLETMVNGIACRASLFSPAMDVTPWQQRRSEQVRRGELRLTLPHCDLLSKPASKISAWRFVDV